MADMRKILKDLMAKHGQTGHSLEDASGVPSATTYRYLRGRHKKLSDITIQKYAKAFGVTDAQFRGYEPIQGVLIPSGESEAAEADDFPHLTKEEKTILKISRRINRESRRAWLKIGIDLSSPPENKEEAAAIRLMLIDTGWGGKERRGPNDRRARPAYGGSAYGPAKNQPGISEKGKRA